MSESPALPFLHDRSGTRYPLDEPRWRGDDGGPLATSALPGITAGAIDLRARSHWRYRAALPTTFRREVTLGEGCTPLLPLSSSEPAGSGAPGLFAKAEWSNPTGSFKDRGMSVLVSTLLAQGVGAFLEDSSGNGGSSAAAYAAAAGLDATILVPRGTSAAKQLLSRLVGARVEEFDGSRTETAAEALRRSATVFYASHNWHPAFLQGVKLLAYELWEDLGFRAPDTVVVPAGGGSLVLGLSLGFAELQRAGEIERMPRVFAAQPANCAPLAEAFDAGAERADTGRLDRWAPTIAEGASIGAPVRDIEVLAAVRSSGGAVLAVSEAEIVAAVRELLARGLYVEPTSGLALAAAHRLLAAGVVSPAETTVLVLTGSGLKAAQAMAGILAAPAASTPGAPAAASHGAEPADAAGGRPA
ncbi:pyridoxal-phosphate dependent enzyme [Herbiconiux solani]|uniref:pyridoxal-phosphate dependent enzyme n=1 Tax=Herbiconiux solani TaxID=661329 RepID=UPI000A02167B|nr:pyridoxal-phosphate dependent enzyme [Herbiconiux solani]